MSVCSHWLRGYNCIYICMRVCVCVCVCVYVCMREYLAVTMDCVCGGGAGGGGGGLSGNHGLCVCVWGGIKW